MNSYEALATRQVNAIHSFCQYVQEQTGCTEEQATHVYDVFRKERVLKIDPVNGTWNVKHGAFLDLDVLKRAITL